MEHLSHLNYLAIAVCTIIYFLLGAVWYSPLLFANKWVAHSNVDREKGKKQMPLLFLNAFVCGAFATFALALLIDIMGITAIPAAIKLALLCGAGFGFTSLSMSYMFGQRSVTLLLIDSGYHIVSLVVVGVVLCIWQ